MEMFCGQKKEGLSNYDKILNIDSTIGYQSILGHNLQVM